MRSPSTLVAIVGPTGSGKSALALHLAKRFPSEVVSCDALQVYRGVDIGTGKLSVSERRGIAHHLLDVADAQEEFSAASYLRLAVPIIERIDAQGKLPLVVGGTGLYLRALLRGLFVGPGRDPQLRHRLAAIAERRGRAFLHRMLGRLDPESATRIHRNDLVRTVRALEVCLLAKRPMSQLMKERESPLSGFRPLLVGIAPPRRELARRIEERVQGMFERGLVDEVRRIIREFGADAAAIKAIGYRQVSQHLAGDIPLDEARQATVRATLQYAKRQMTWFRREQGVVWFQCFGDDLEASETIEKYLRARIALKSSERSESLEPNRANESSGPWKPFESFKEEGVHAKTAS